MLHRVHWIHLIHGVHLIHRISERPWEWHDNSSKMYNRFFAPINKIQDYLSVNRDEKSLTLVLQFHRKSTLVRR